MEKGKKIKQQKKKNPKNRKIKKQKKEKSKKIEKGKNSKNKKKENPQKNGKRKKIQKKKKRKSLFPAVLDKMCIFCLYPIPDSQQCVKRDSCRCPILSELFCSFFIFLGVKPDCAEFRVWASDLSRLCYLLSL